MVVRIISATYLTNQEPSRIFLSVRSSLFFPKIQKIIREILFFSHSTRSVRTKLSPVSFVKMSKQTLTLFFYLRAYSLSLSFSNYALTHNYKPINKSNYVKFMVRFLFLCFHTNNRSYLYFLLQTQNSVTQIVNDLIFHNARENAYAKNNSLANDLIFYNQYYMT